MESPRPVPATFFVSVRCSCANGSNTCGRNSGLMPMPLSSTIMRRLKPFSAGSSRSTEACTVPPSGVYLIALESRFSRIFCILSRSTWTTASGLTASMLESRWIRFRSAEGPSAVRTARISSPAGTSCSSSTALPLSMRDISSVSLIRSISRFPDVSIFFRYSCFFAALVSFSASRVKPMMPLSGVRRSWDMLERNSDFAWLARSASSLVRRSSSIWRLSLSAWRVMSERHRKIVSFFSSSQENCSSFCRAPSGLGRE